MWAISTLTVDRCSHHQDPRELRVPLAETGGLGSHTCRNIEQQNDTKIIEISRMGYFIRKWNPWLNAGALGLVIDACSGRWAPISGS